MLEHKDDRVELRKRRLLRAIGSGVLVSTGAESVLASPGPGDEGTDLPGDGPGKNGRGRGEYPKIPEGGTPTVPISAVATQIAYHPNHDRAIFTSAVFDERFELYVAEGVDGPAATSDDIWLLTDTERPVLAPEFLKNNRIRYNRNLTRYERKLPPSNKVYESEIIEENSLVGVNSL